MFAFGVRYLNGFVAAAERGDRAEWPPHPGRVFMALAAAHFQTGADPAEREALLWLEALEQNGEPIAPCLVASDKVYHRFVATHYVPVNDKAGPSKSVLHSIPLTRNRQDRRFVRAWLNDDTVFLVWADVDPDEPVRTALQGLCGKVTRIGHSSSLVQMWMAQAVEVGEPNWFPNEDQAIVRLRLAPRGTLQNLEHRYNGATVETYAGLLVSAADASDEKAQKIAKRRLKEEFADGPPVQLRPVLGMYQGYAQSAATKSVATRVAGTVFSPHMTTLRLERQDGPFRQLDLLSVLAVSQRWREALLSQSNDLTASARTVLTGHDADGAPLQDAHLAFVPLGFVGHEHATGHLLGVAIALPKDLSGDDRHEILLAVARIRELKLGRLGLWRVEAISAAPVGKNIQAPTWTAYPEGATHWSSVTPIVYDSHPKSKEKGAYLDEIAGMIGRCCTRIGLPGPREVIVTPVSAHLGAPPAHDFPRLRRKDGSLRRHTHAILVFDEPVCGPMLLGAGRYRGYGLCRPMRESRLGRGSP